MGPSGARLSASAGRGLCTGQAARYNDECAAIDHAAAGCADVQIGGPRRGRGLNHGSGLIARVETVTGGDIST